MYECTDCGQRFERPAYTTERHGLDNPPFEPLAFCPTCKSNHFHETRTAYCRCCGSKLSPNKTEYCSDACRRRGIKWRELDELRRQFRQSNPLELTVKLLETYNREHRTRYSYGQFVALILPKLKEGYRL